MFYTLGCTWLCNPKQRGMVTILMYASMQRPWFYSQGMCCRAMYRCFHNPRCCRPTGLNISTHKLYRRCTNMRSLYTDNLLYVNKIEWLFSYRFTEISRPSDGDDWYVLPWILQLVSAPETRVSKASLCSGIIQANDPYPLDGEPCQLNRTLNSTGAQGRLEKPVYQDTIRVAQSKQNSSRHPHQNSLPIYAKP